MRKPDLSCAVEAHQLGRTPAHSRQAWKVLEDPIGPSWSRPPLMRRPLVRWLLHFPYLHPAWDYFLISLIDLKPHEGVPEAVLEDPAFEYELAAFAVNPEFVPDPDCVSTIWLLVPPCVVKQFGGVNSRSAIAVAESCVLACVGGALAPDSDLRRSWSASVEAELCRLKRER